MFTFKKKKEKPVILLNFLDFSGDFKNFSKFFLNFRDFSGNFPHFQDFAPSTPICRDFLLRARHFRCGDVLARAKKFQK